MLRKGQKELVETYKGGFCGVPAIPGGGKTFALTQWVVNAICEGINKPGKILIVTYMTSAVNNFKQRISKELEKRGINSRDFFVSTIHSLCLQIIKESPDLLSINEEFDIIDSLNKFHLIKESINAWKRRGDNLKLYNYYLDDLVIQQKGYEKVNKEWDKTFVNIVSSAISDFKINEISAKKAFEITRGLPVTSFLRVSAEIYEDYEARLRRRGMIDFEDMLSKAKYILANNSAILEKFQKKYTFICEDEAQDSNKLQTEILTLIAGKNGNFLRVGDSNQAIMTTFANSDMKLFKEFCENENHKIFRIVQSSRNSVQIINLANDFVRFVRENHPTEECRESLVPQFIEPVDKNDDFPNPVVEGEAIFTNSFKKIEDEYEAIANKCRELIYENKDKTIAVLIPVKWKIDIFLKVLDEKKIEYDHLDDFAGQRNEILVLLGRVLDFIGLPEKNEKLIELIKVLIDEETPGRELLIDYLSKVSTEEIFYPISGEISKENMPEELIDSIVWGRFLKIRDMLIEFMEFPITMIDKLVLYIAERMEFKVEDMAIAQKVASTVKFLVSEEPRYKVLDLAAELLNQKNIFNYFANLVWELKGYEAKPGVVTVATYHKSKGMEWDNVFLTDLDAVDFPTKLNDKFKDEYDYLKAACSNPSRMLKEDMAKVMSEDTKIDYRKQARIDVIAERARLLYVGITRAKEKLFISTVKNSRTRASEYFNFIENNIR